MLKKILVVSCLLLLTQFSAFSQEIIQEKSNIFKTRDITKILRAYPNSKLIIRSALTLSGKISIEVGDTDHAELRYFKRAKSKNKSQAIDFIDLISIDFEQTQDGLKLDLRAPNPAPWSGTNQSGSVEISLILPEFCDVEIEAPQFDIDAEGPFDSFIVPSSFGRIYIENVIEKLEVVASNRRVTVRNLSGEIYVSTTNATLEAEQIHSQRGRVELRNDGGDIKVVGIKGELYLKNSYGRVEIIEYTPIGRKNSIRCSYGPISLELKDFNTEQLLVTNQYEDIEISLPDDISASLSLAVEEGGKIIVSDMVIKPDIIQENRLNLIIGNGENSINSSIRGSGNIYLRGISEGE